MSDKTIEMWEVVVTYEVMDIHTVDKGPSLMQQRYVPRQETRTKRYLAKPNGDDIGNFLSNFLPYQPIVSVEVKHYRAELSLSKEAS